MLQADPGVCRRSDVFGAAEIAAVHTEVAMDLAFRGPEVIRLMAEAPMQLDGHDLALLLVLTDLAWRKESLSAIAGRTYVHATPLQLLTRVYGPPGPDGHPGYRYHALGLTRAQVAHEAPPGALQRLHALTVAAQSQWQEWVDGEWTPVEVVDSFHPVERVRWRRYGRWEHLYVALAPELLLAQRPTFIPPELLQALGPARGVALRLAVHVLSHAPLPTGPKGQREIGLSRLVAVIRPPASRDPGRFPGRFRRYVQELVAVIDQADPHHRWAMTDSSADPLGKIVCQTSNCTTSGSH